MMMALMASGLNGQNFAFNGYIPIDQPERTRKLRGGAQIARTELEQRAKRMVHREPEHKQRHRKRVQILAKHCQKVHDRVQFLLGYASRDILKRQKVILNKPDDIRGEHEQEDGERDVRTGPPEVFARVASGHDEQEQREQKHESEELAALPS